MGIPQFICVADNLVFPSLEELDAHEKSGHVLQPAAPEATVEELSLRTPEQIEFDKTLKLMNDDKAKRNADQAAEIERLKQKGKPPPQPLMLKYQWTGTCPTCGNTVKTIVVDDEAGSTAIAYCLTEDVQLESRKVAKLVNKIPPPPEPESVITETKKENDNSKNNKQIPK